MICKILKIIYSFMKIFNFFVDILLYLIDINDLKCSEKFILFVIRRSLKYWKVCGEKIFFV